MTDVDPHAATFAELDALLGKEQFRAATKKADELLKVVRGDVDVLRCKVFALLRRGRYGEVVSATNGMADEELKFYAAYAHYKLNNFSEALKHLTSLRIKAKTQAVQELKGQILYKQGNFNQARLTFEQCMTQYNVETVDVKTNLLAALAASGTPEQMEELAKKYGIAADDGFEITFNMGCSHIALGNYDTAMELLQLAFRSGQESLLLEELTEEEVEVELLPVTVQLSYVQSLGGMAASLTKDLIEAAKKPGIGGSMKCVIDNNILAAKSLNFSDHPPKRLLYESAKKLEKMLVPSPMSLLSPTQRVLVGCNQALLLIALNHMEDAQPIVEQLLDEAPNLETVQMTHAVMLTKQNKVGVAAEVVQGILDKSEKSNLGPLLFRAQLLCLEGSSKEALKLLAGIQDDSIKFKGSMIATKIALMEQVSDYAGCAQLLDAALRYWRQQGHAQNSHTSVAIAWCLEKYADVKLRQGDLVGAVECCQEALAAEQDDLRRNQIVSKLTRILGSSDFHGNLDIAALLPQGPELSVEEVDELEGNVKGIKRGEISSQKRQHPGEGSQVKRRKRKPRYPKGFDLNNPGPMPDPERWLPKWQRSGYRKKQHGRRKDAVKGSQGAGKVDESLDRALHPAEGSTTRQHKTSNRSGPRRKGRR